VGAIGKSVIRLDAREKVTGAAKYTVDLTLPGMAYGKILRSPYAHARIVAIDTSKAEALPGVLAVVTGKDLPLVRIGPFMKDMTVFAREKVRYIGEEVAAVAAVEEGIAEEALDLIEVEYEELPAVFDPEEALKPDAPILHEHLEEYETMYPMDLGGNVCSRTRFYGGDVEKGFAECAVIVEDEFTTQAVHHQYLENRVAIASFDGAGDLTIWTSNASAYLPRNWCAEALQMPFSKVRVIVPYVGGAFGGKSNPWLEPYPAVLAKKCGRPVRIALTGEEELSYTVLRHPSRTRLKMGFKEDGTLHAMEARTLLDGGAYPYETPGPTDHAAVRMRGPYLCPHIDIEVMGVLTNKEVSGAFRGYGNPQISWAREQLMDVAAERLGMDPTELRLKNFSAVGDTLATGQVITSNGIAETMRDVIDGHPWHEEAANASGSHLKRGSGVACMEHCSGLLSSSALFMIYEDGTGRILSGAVEIGAGEKTTLAQIAAETLGVPLEDIAVTLSDTAVTPHEHASCASRITFGGGRAVKLAVEDAKGQLLALAAKRLQLNADDLEIEERAIIDRRSGEQVSTVREIALASHVYEHGPILGRGTFYPPEPKRDPSIMSGVATPQWPTHMYATQAVEIEVDAETGVIRPLRLTASHDVGKAIDPLRLAGQVGGGFAQGIGYALMEEVKWDEGKVITPTMVDYKIPTAMDVPRTTFSFVELEDPDGPFGAKGIGEGTLVPVAPAIGNALYRACGVRIRHLPITPEAVLEALEGNSSEVLEETGGPS